MIDGKNTMCSFGRRHRGSLPVHTDGTVQYAWRGLFPLWDNTGERYRIVSDWRPLRFFQQSFVSFASGQVAFCNGCSRRVYDLFYVQYGTSDHGPDRGIYLCSSVSWAQCHRRFCCLLAGVCCGQCHRLILLQKYDLFSGI